MPLAAANADPRLAGRWRAVGLEVDGKPRPISAARFVRFVETGEQGVQRAAQPAPGAVADRGFASILCCGAGR